MKTGIAVEGKNCMPKIDNLKAQIESLPSEEFAEIFRWLSEKGWERWDKEIEADSQAGKARFPGARSPR